MFEQYDEICKYFTEGKQRDNNANEVQKHLQLHDLSMGEYVTDKNALWFNFMTINGNALYEMGRREEVQEEESPCRSRRKQNQLESSRLTST